MNTKEEISLTSPFYGKIYFRKECGYNWVSTVRGEVVCDGEMQEFGCTNYNCGGGGWCSCTGYTNHIFLNKPMGTSISICSQYCYQGEWLEVPLNFVSAGNNQYNLYGTNPATGEYNYFGFVKFIATQPPITVCDQYACSSDQLEVPYFCLEEKPNGYNNIDVCKPISGAEMAAFYPIFNIPEDNFQISACYNKQYQRWWFNIDEGCFKFFYIKTICEENINSSGRKMIWDWQEYPDYLSCDEIEDNIFGHFSYGSVTGDYVLGILLDIHEELHKLDFEYIMAKEYLKLKDAFLGLNISCDDSNSPQFVEVYFYEKIDSISTQLFRKVKSDWDEFRGNYDSSGDRKMEYEFNTHNSFSVHAVLYNQLYEIIKFRGC